MRFRLRKLLWLAGIGLFGVFSPPILHAQDVKVMHWNIEKGLGTTALNTNTAAKAIARIVNFHQPDVILINELQSANLATNTAALTDWVTNNLPYMGSQPGVTFFIAVSSITDGFNRNAAISRWPILTPTTFDDGLRGLHSFRVQLIGTNQLQLFHAHFKCCSDGDSCSRRQANAQFAADTISAWAATNSIPYVFGGDWNEDETNPLCTLTSSYNPIATVREDGGLVEFRPTDLNGDYRTWSTATTSPSIRFDYLLAATNRLTPSSGLIFNTKTWAQHGQYTNVSPQHLTSDSATASDHYPVLVNYFFPSGPPFISGVNATNITDTTADIVWTTDTDSSSKVRYGTSPSGVTNAATAAGLVKNHTVPLSGLGRGVTYYYEVISTNSLGVTTNNNLGAFFTFETKILDVFGVAATNILDTSATIVWKTDRNSDSRVRFWQRDAAVTSTVFNASLVTNHTLNLSGLTSGKTYLYEVISASDSDVVTNNNNGAYFEFTTLVRIRAFFENVESGTNSWTFSSGPSGGQNLWHVVGPGSAWNTNKSPVRAWWYGGEATGNYRTGGNANSGNIVTPPFQINRSGSLTFWSWEQTENVAGRDTRKAYVTTNNGASWILLFNSSNNASNWYQVGPISLNAFSNRTAKLRFEFDTVNGNNNNFRGWYIDDIEVTHLSLPAAPVANAGSPQTVAPGALVTLNGSSSTGTNLTYQWTQTSGEPVTLNNSNTAAPSFTAPNLSGSAESALIFLLTVTDEFGRRASSSVTVTVVVPAPVADAGPDQTVPSGTLVQLNGANSTGNLLTYQWTQTAGATVTLSDANSATPTFTAPNNGNQTLTFQLAVTDNFERQVTDSVNIFVKAPPVANAGPNQTVIENSLVTLDGSASTGFNLGYNWTQISGSAVTLNNSNTVQATFTSPPTGTRAFQLIVADSFGRTSTNSTQVISGKLTIISVAPDNGPPSGGTTITITGTGFTNDTSVAINGNSATSVAISNSTLLTAVTPAGTAGAKNVTLSNPSPPQTAVLTNGFTYQGAIFADFSASPTIGPAPLDVNFTDQSVGTVTFRHWNFGDSGTSIAQNPSHTYAEGVYTVSLTVSNESESSTRVKTNLVTATPAGAKTWIGSGTGTLTDSAGTRTVWSTNVNWSGGAPTLADVAFVSATTNGTISVTASTSVGKLTVNSAGNLLNFDIGANNLTVTNADITTISANTTLSGGTLSATNAELRIGGTFTMNSGLLSGNVVNVQGTFKSIGGTFTAKSAFINNGTFVAMRSSATSILGFNSSIVFSNSSSGRILIETNALLFTNNIVNLGTIEARNTATFGTSTSGWFTNAVGGTILNTNSAATFFVRANSGSFANAGSVVVSNNATVNFINASGTGQNLFTTPSSYIQIGNATSSGFINTGTFNNQGTLEGQGRIVTGLGSGGRSFTNSATATLRVIDNGLLIITNVTQIGNSGTIRIGSSSELRIAPTNETTILANSGTISMSCGTISFYGNAPSVITNAASGYIFGGGTITNASVVNNGTISATTSNCALNFANAVTNRAGAIISAENGGVLNFYGFVTNFPGATIVTTNGSVRFFGGIGNGGTILLDDNGDADSDGLPNKWEIDNSLNPLDPAGANGPGGDPDGDTLTNLQEYNLGTNPKNADTDGDGLPDNWEVTNGLNPSSASGDNGASGDPDGDGLTNAQEFSLGTDPKNADTDGNGMSDGFEKLYFGTPTGNNPAADPDGDGLTNLQEFSFDTNPTNSDTDGDGLPDGWEIAFGLNPKDNGGDNGASGDADGDGFTNAQEYAAGTDPTDSSSAFEVLSLEPKSAGDVLTWTVVEGKTYQPQVRENLLNGSWTDLGAPITAESGQDTISVTNAPSGSTRFYRVILVTPP